MFEGFDFTEFWETSAYARETNAIIKLLPWQIISRILFEDL